MPKPIDHSEHKEDKTPGLKKNEQEAARNALDNPTVSAEIEKSTKREEARNAPKKVPTKKPEVTKEIEPGSKDKIQLSPEGREFLDTILPRREKSPKFANYTRHFEQMSFVLNGNSVLLKDFLLNASFNQRGGLLYRDSDIPAGHDLLKLAQLYLRSQNLSVLDGNKKNDIQSIDGHFRNDSMDALKTYQNIIREKQTALSEWIRGVVNDFSESIRTKGKENPELQSERGDIKVNVYGNVVELSSYSGVTKYDLSTGSIFNRVEQQKSFPKSRSSKKFEFTGGFELSKSRDTGEYLKSDVNNKNLEAIIGFMNLLNRANYLSDNIKNKSVDNYRPFHLDSTNLIAKAADLMTLSATSNIPGMTSIQVENGLKDENLIKISNLQEYLKPFDNKVTRQSVIKYLNNMHEFKYRPLPSNKKVITTGGRSF